MTRFSRTLLLALLLGAGTTAHAGVPPPPATVVPLNDTGQTLCYDSTGTAVSCATVADDGRYGRDAANTAGALTKTGAGTKGFDFTKIANDGTTLPAGATPRGAAATDWACTQDNVTGLTWEVKIASTGIGLSDFVHTYTWYSADAASNGGNAGNLGTNTCGSTLSAYSNQCNTANYVAAVNAAALCRFTDWRLPSLRELQSLVDFSVLAIGAAPTLDDTYFPNTPIDKFWTANNNSTTPANAWFVNFLDGNSNAADKSNIFYVRLVRGGQ